MSRHFCPYTEEQILCIAESRGDIDIVCDECDFKIESINQGDTK